MSRKLISIVLAAILAFGSATEIMAAHIELPPGQHFTLVDENNKIILQTGRMVYVGDEYIAADNSVYKVVRVENNKAYCEYKGKEKMPEVKPLPQKTSWFFNRIVPVQGNEDEKPTVAIYATHSDESYIDGDGTESIDGQGGIYDVAEALKERLESLGINVVYSENNHNPHDVNAYHRSRRTAAKLLKEDPTMKIDVHRDATPAEQYKGKVEGEPVGQIKIVIGRSNPNSQTNKEFAKRIKAVMDKEKPGLSNGILMAKGDYNQDLSSRAILIEVGSHKTPKDEAITGVEHFAEIIPTVLGVSEAGPAQKPMTEDNRSAGTTILIILLVLGAAVGGFYLLNRGTGESKS